MILCEDAYFIYKQLYCGIIYSVLKYFLHCLIDMNTMVLNSRFVQRSQCFDFLIFYVCDVNRLHLFTSYRPTAHQSV
jgi:hypothetical protein